MAKRVKSVRRPHRQEKKTNWLLIGGVIGLAAIALFALLALNLKEPEAQEAQSLADYCQENPANCATNGSADAPVTIVEVSDYGCSHCRDFNLQTAGLIEDLYVTPGQVQWMVLPFALGSQTAPAAAAAMCANEQDRFFDFHRRLFELGPPQSLTEAGFLQAANDVGLDADSFATCIASGRHQQSLQENIRVATLAGINATPSFFVNGQLIEGNRPLTTFQQEISSAVGSADAE
jgi:protein-disulfide isomerase